MLWHMKPICSGSVYVVCMAKVTVRLTCGGVFLFHFLLHACQKKTGAWPGREAQAGYFVCMKVFAAVLVKVRNIKTFATLADAAVRRKRGSLGGGDDVTKREN